jgi:MFS transporter, DHA1 family, tetracycline resistance protein
MRRFRSPTVVLAAASGLLASGYGVLFTMLDDYRDEYGISESALGAVIGIGFFAGFLSSVLIAPLADRGHAKRLVIAGLVLGIVGLLLMAVSTAVVPLLAGRFVMGIGTGTTVPAVRRIVIVAEPERLGHNLGRLLAADVGGFALGPAVSAVLVGPFGIPAPFLVIAVLTFVVLVFVWQLDVTETRDAVSQRLALDLLRIRPFAGAVVLGGAAFLMIGAFDALWAVVLDDLETSTWIANAGITLFALPLIVLATPGGRLAQRVGPFRVATVGLLLGATFMTLYGLMPSGGAMFAVAMVHALSDGLSISSTGVAAGMTVPAERQAGAQGVLGAFETLVAGFTALVTGALYEAGGRTTAYTAAAVGMVVFVGVGVLLAREQWGLRGMPLSAELPDSPATIPV